MDCIFCKIAAGQIPSSGVFESETVYAFDDINPLAPVHVLIVPKKHIKNIDDINADTGAIMGDIFAAANRIAEIKGVKEKGYRLIINNGTAGGQEVWHMHVHLLGGRDTMGPMLCP
jgi:histidine triad (HIT) family protein